MINSPQHKLAKLRVKILKSLKHYYSKWNVKDSFCFAEDIVELHINHETISVFFSFDIKSLYISIPIVESIEMCVEELFNLGLAPPHLKKMFEELLS